MPTATEQREEAGSLDTASVETIGVSAIPDAQRTMPAGTLFTIWGLASRRRRPRR